MKKLLYLKDEELKQYIEKIFTGYRETVADPKKILDKYSIGIAHNKVIHLISLYEGITISELLKKLKVTKQSLNRVLNDLIKLNAIKYKKDEVDTRIKHVYLTQEGKKLAEVTEALCTGCGVCNVACPTGAASLAHFRDEQINVMIEESG